MRNWRTTNNRRKGKSRVFSLRIVVKKIFREGVYDIVGLSSPIPKEWEGQMITIGIDFAAPERNGK